MKPLKPKLSLCLCVLACAALAQPTSASASPLVDPETPAGVLPYPGQSGWELVFSDEFNGTTLDTSKWGVDVSTKTRAPRWDRGIADWYWVEENVSLDGSGSLVLDVTKHDSNTMHCGSISSDGLYEPKYGYLEARIQIGDSTKDTHTAFWLQGANMTNGTPPDGTGNDGAEVDIFESAWFGDYTKSVVHIDGYGADKQASTKQYDTPGLHSGYNHFGLEWTPNSMKIYYSGVHKVTYTAVAADAGKTLFAAIETSSSGFDPSSPVRHRNGARQAGTPQGEASSFFCAG